MKSTHFLFFLIALAGVYFTGFFIDVMDVDASQYASMAREMLENGSYLKVKERYLDYLDKPPLIFWLGTLSFKLFGVNNFAFKLPSFVFAIIALYSTLRFARIYYSEEIARLAVLITGTCQAFFLMNNDCRTDTILTGSVMLAIYHLAAYLQKGGKWHFVWAFIGIGLAMLTKGPLGLVFPAMAIGADLLAKQQWKNIFRTEWIIGVLIVGLMLLPMCIGLYQQFGSKGLEFYFWKQSFGRITGDNEFVKQLTDSDYVNDPTFFYHTFLWAFLPWPILFIAGLVYQAKNFIKNKFKVLPDKEIITTAGFVLTFIMMSNSQYKLPHYIFAAFPLAGILTARFCVENLNGKLLKWMFGIHVFIIICLWLVLGFLVCFSFSQENLISILLFILLLIITLFLTIKIRNEVYKLLTMVLLSIISVNFLLNFHVYPRLLKYQPTNEIGRIIKSTDIPAEKIYMYQPASHSLDFYAGKIIPHNDINMEKFAQNSFKPGDYLILDENMWVVFQILKRNYTMIFTGDQFHVSMVTLPFLNPATRSQTTKKIYFLKVE